MKIYYDTQIDAVDIEFKKGTVAETKELSPEVMLDVDKKGNPLSLEILGASKRYPKIDFGTILVDLPKMKQEKTLMSQG
ncbi:DUF2283 domain-containing protein [Candidatus Berkelbacteria bacterium]|nr:DUF2283 domain-containing protein [Candidatus Berkelbacteria bacterium]